MKKIKAILNELKRLWLYKLIVAGFAALAFCLYTFLTVGQEAVTYLSLNYPAALQGQYLNGTRLNMYDILSEEILEYAIENAGLEYVVSPAELQNMITISPRHTSHPENAYMATEFEVNLFMQKSIDGVSAEGLLQMVCMAFVENFYSTHANNQALLEFSLSDIDNMDYNEIGVMLRTKIDLMADYVNYRYNSDQDFYSHETGEGFSSLRMRISDFSNVLLEKYNSYVSDNGITKDQESLRSSLGYEQLLLWQNYNKEIVNYDVRIEAIEQYDTIQSAVVMIPTVDSSGEFYMSKTRTGIDYLAQAANEAMNKAKTVKMRIDKDTALLNRAKSANVGSEVLLRTENMISEVLSSIEALEQLVLKTDNDYIRQETAKSLMYRMRKPQDRDFYEFKETAVVFVAVFIALSVLNWFLTRHAPKKRGKGVRSDA